MVPLAFPPIWVKGTMDSIQFSYVPMGHVSKLKPRNNSSRSQSDGTAFGQLHAEESEMTFGFLSLTHPRSKFFAYSYPVEPDLMGLFIQRPSTLKKWLVMVWPLDTLSWMLMLICMAIFTVSLWLWFGTSTNFFSVLGVTLSVLLKKGLTGYLLNARLKSHKTRLFLAGWILTVLIMKIWYRTTLRAFLIAPLAQKVPSTFEDAMSQSSEVYALKDSSSDTFIQDVNLKIFQDLRKSGKYTNLEYGKISDAILKIQTRPNVAIINS
eukprot:maker-scaffold253_size237113-snap-gene-1.35 protein:Tk00292 transcript:maker-scaffold253_size237113-snap-gene-1.35-mRNA-1 annotation:"hypothetical protein DAPPUDRAFT_319599"